MDPSAFILPLAGIAVVLIAVWALGGRRDARVDAAAARQRIGEDLPDFACGQMLVDAALGCVVALAADGDGAAIAFRAGARIAVRRLRRGAVATIGRNGARLALDCRDFTRRRFALTAADAAQAERWEGLLRRAFSLADAPVPDSPAGRSPA